MNIGGNYFRVHPAFIDDSENNYENGGWDKELPGIWVGKYETSLAKKSDGSDFAPKYATVIDEKTYAIKVEANKRYWSYAETDNQYTMAKAYNTNLNSHMLKNSEWGAMAYLTESKYGRNGKNIERNDEAFSTGSIANIGQSSTGNETGIYNLNGGAFERVSAYLKDADISQTGEPLVNEIEKKYVTVYTGTNERKDYKSGDATYETILWNYSYGDFVDLDDPFFVRGSSYRDGDGGCLRYDGDGGTASYNFYSFRMCLAIK